MGKRLPYTPNSFIRSMLRRYIWLRSRERVAALKAAEYTCEQCGRKQSKAKGREIAVEVHHRKGIEAWDKVIAVIRLYLLPPDEDLQVLCKECHKQFHNEENKK